MKRYLLLLAGGSVGVLSLFLLVYLLVDQPSEPDTRMVRARALFETQNYLSALNMLRAMPADRNGGRPHAYLGATYLHLHLYQAALDEFEAASRQNPGTLDPWIGLAVVNLRLGNGPKALEGAGRAVRVAEDSADAWLVLGRAHYFQRSFGAAENAALKVHELDPSDPHATELLLRIYLEQNDAVKFQQLLDRTSNPTKGIQDLAVQFAVRQGKFRHAYDLHTRFERRQLEARILRSQLALARDPGEAGLYPGLVRDLVKVARFQEAIAAGLAYNGPVSLDFELGKAHWLAGNREGAIQSYARASAEGTHKLSAEVALAAITGDDSHWLEAFRAERLEKDYFVLSQLETVLPVASPLSKAFAYRYAGLFDPSFFNLSAQQALSQLDVEPNRFEALMTLGNAYHRLGRVEDAIQYVARGRDLFPRRAEAWARLGQLALTKNDAQGALQYLETALLLEPGNASHLYNFGWILDQLGRDAEAAPYYERAIAASSLSFEAMNNLALLEAESGDPDRALVLLNRAVTANPENEAAYLNRANYFAAQRLWREATRDYEHVLELDPTISFASVELGRIQLELGNVDRALERLNQALEVDPNSYDAYVLMSSAYKRMDRTHEADAAMAEARRIRPNPPPEESVAQ